MLFNSLEFLVFLTIVYALYRVLPFRLQNYMLLAASYVFYGWWDWRFLFLTAFSTVIDYWVGLTMQNEMGRREKILPAVFISISSFMRNHTGSRARMSIDSDLASAPRPRGCSPPFTQTSNG